MTFPSWKKTGLFFTVLSLAAAASAVTVTVDGNATVPGTSYSKLSEAVSYTNSQGAGPHTINITADSFLDGGVCHITQPVTINGNADGDATPCAILVDIAGLIGQPVPIPGFQAFIQIASPGDVIIKDLKLHPDEQGATVVPVGAVSTDNPPSGMSNYTLQNVQISGSTSALGFIDPATDADIFEDLTNITWVPTDNEDATVGGVVHVTSSTDTMGDYNLTLDHCQVAMGRGSAVGVYDRGGEGKTTILGGLYGHCAKTGLFFFVNNKNITVKGTYEDRVRIVRCNKSNSGSGLTMEDSSIELLEYIDSYLHEAGSWNFVLWNSTCTLMQHCRLWHGLDPTTPSAGTGGRLMRIADDSNIHVNSCTFYVDNAANTPGDGNANEDFSMTITDAGGGVSGNLIFTNSVFASDGPAGANASDGYFILRGSGLRTLDYCGLPTDDNMAENLEVSGNPPLPVAKGPNVDIDTTTCLFVSPQFTPVAYDVSDPSNPTFLLPTNSAYDAAASDGTKLVGGVGQPSSGINDWMLMEDRRRFGRM